MNPILFNLYSSQTNFVLEAVYKDANNQPLSAPTTDGFLEKGKGEYQFTPGIIPDGATSIDIQKASDHTFLISLDLPDQTTATPVQPVTPTLSYQSLRPIIYYATIPVANDYFSRRFHSEPWWNATPKDQLSALAESTRAIDNLAFKGRKQDPSQPLEFPRVMLPCNPAILSPTTASYLNTPPEIPRELQIACCENALMLLDGVDPEEERRNISVTSRRYAQVGTTYDTKFPPEYFAAGIVSATAWNLLRPWLADTRSVRINRA